jgi:hypothetical protein
LPKEFGGLDVRRTEVTSCQAVLAARAAVRPRIIGNQVSHLINGIIAVRGNNSDFRPRGNSASLRRFLHATIACHYCLRTTFSEEPAASDDPADLLSRTESFWRDWSNHCRQTLRTP